MRQFEVAAPTHVDLREFLPAVACNDEGSEAVVSFDELNCLLLDVPASVRLTVTTGEWQPH